MKNETLKELIARFRSLPADHAPDGFPAVQTKEITALVDHIDTLTIQLDSIGAGGVEALRKPVQATEATLEQEVRIIVGLLNNREWA